MATVGCRVSLKYVFLRRYPIPHKTSIPVYHTLFVTQFNREYVVSDSLNLSFREMNGAVELVLLVLFCYLSVLGSVDGGEIANLKCQGMIVRCQI